jgi:hypothetical protein
MCLCEQTQIIDDSCSFVQVLELQPSGEVKAASARAQLLTVLREFPELNKTALPAKLWAGQI